MKKILLLILFSSLLFSRTEIKIIDITEGKEKIKLDNLYYKKAKEVFSELWIDNVTEEGELTINFKILSRKGKFESYHIIKETRNEKFNNQVERFLRDIRDIRINRERTESGYLNITVSFSFIKERVVTIDPISVYKDAGDKIYKDYIKYLKYSKGYTRKKVDKILSDEKNTITKFMLLAIYNDYIINDEKKYNHYYDIIINQKLDRFINSVEGLYLVDYLLRGKEYGLVLEILPELSCQLMKEPEKSECFYFRASSLYNLGNEGYIIPLRKAKERIPQAKNLIEEIKEKKMRGE